MHLDRSCSCNTDDETEQSAIDSRHGRSAVVVTSQQRRLTGIEPHPRELRSLVTRRCEYKRLALANATRPTTDRYTHAFDGAGADVKMIRMLQLITASFAFSAACVVPAMAAETAGARLYRDTCAACHGAAGRGQPQSQVGFDVPLPDFTDCSFATREPDEDWFAIVHSGGPTRRFDEMMPAFGEALRAEEIQQILDHVRTLCTERDWPRGELNLPRALLTEKAYPEDEAVITATMAAEGRSTAEAEIIWERRLGARSQFELSVPFSLQSSAAPQGREAGIGDVALGLKHVLYHDLDGGSILSAGVEAVLPTGDDARGLGKGTAALEPFISFGRILPSASFVQLQMLAELPIEPGFDDEVAWRVAIGTTWTSGRFGRIWTPMLEVVGSRELVSSARTNWDLVPQLQVSLSTRQHVLANLGLRIPETDTATRDTQVMLYVLWDWFDGGLLDGW